jgi:hypothetical protein
MLNRMSGCMTAPFLFMAHGRDSLPPPTPNGKSKTGVEAWSNREIGVILKLIGELKVCHFVFCHNSHSQVREASVDRN